MTNYPTIEDIERIIKRPAFRGTDARIMNEGLLKAALERPKTAFYGKEQYPEIYQKAAVLMEAICKNHALSDGNKRTAVAAAEMMVRINGCRLILPLKAVRLLADTAMDGGDQMSGQIQAWFKAHVASNPIQLRIMLDEIIDENDAIDELLKRGGGEKIASVLDEWLAFDNHPELRKQWEAELGPERAARGRDPAGAPVSVARLRHRAGLKRYDSDTYKGYSLQESKARYARMCELEASFDRDDPYELFESALVFYELGFMYETLAFLEDARRLGRDEAQRLEVGVLLEMDKYPECAELGEDLLKRMPKDAETISNVAHARYAMGDYQKALDLLDGMLKGDPRHARQASMTLHKSGQRDKAYKLLEQARQADPENPNNASLKAVMLARDGRTDEAVRLWDEVLQSRPRDADIMYNKGAALASMGYPQRAQECYRNVLEIDPEHARAATALEALCAADDAD